MIWRTVQFQKKLFGKASQIAVRNISVSNPSRKTFYEILGLPSDASQAQIKKAYFELSKMYHPDRIEATDENLTKFREITTAYEVLNNEQSRKLYDRGLLIEGTKVKEDVSEVVDPIVKFYKQRQALTKEILKASEEVKTWSPPMRKHAKSPILQKYNFYRKPYELNYTREDPLRYGYAILLTIISWLFLSVNFRETKVRQKWKEIVAYFE